MARSGQAAPEGELGSRHRGRLTPSLNLDKEIRTLSNPPALRFLPSASVAHQGGLPVHLYPPQGASGSQAFRSPWAGNPGQLGQNVIDYFKDAGAWKAVSGCWRVFFILFYCLSKQFTSFHTHACLVLNVWGPGWVVPLVRASSLETKVARFHPGQGTQKIQPRNL